MATFFVYGWGHSTYIVKYDQDRLTEYLQKHSGVTKCRYGQKTGGWSKFQIV